MLGRSSVRVNGMPDADGGTDPTSSAYSPLVTLDLAPVRFPVGPHGPDQTQPDNPNAQNVVGSGNWGAQVGRAGVRDYVDPDVGGQPGNSRTLGWSEGLRIRREMSPFLTGRVLALKSQLAHPNIGQVGRDNRANRLFAAVATQGTDYTPQSSAEVAAQFTGKGIQLT